jgi:hypothetical protein
MNETKYALIASWERRAGGHLQSDGEHPQGVAHRLPVHQAGDDQQ